MNRYIIKSLTQSWGPGLHRLGLFAGADHAAAARLGGVGFPGGKTGEIWRKTVEKPGETRGDGEK